MLPRGKIARATDLAEGTTVKFTFRRSGRPVAGFIACHQGQLVAYENRCRHLPLPLDEGDDLFFTPDGHYLRCRHHGALFEPLSWLCIRGPCAGASLARLSIEVRKGIVWLGPDARPRHVES